MDSIKRAISLILTIILVISICPVCTPVRAATASDTGTTFTVETVSGMPGGTVEVDVHIEDNPGILGATLKVSYDDSLTLVNAAAGEAFAALDMTKPGQYVSGCNFVWDAQDLTDEEILDGVILTLTFEVAEDVEVNQTLSVNVTADADDIFDTNFDDVPFTISDGGVLVIDYLPGDVNDDGVINTKDVVFLRRHLAGGYDQTINEAAADVNDDGKTITFTYTPTSVATSQFLTNGTWWNANSNGTGITYSVNAEYQNRTANSVQVRIVWTQTIKNAAFGYNQYFYCSLWHNNTNMANTGNVKIASTSTWPYYGSSGPWHNGSVTASSGWITVSLNTTNATTVGVACDWWTESSSQSGSWSGKNISIPAY